MSNFFYYDKSGKTYNSKIDAYINSKEEFNIYYYDDVYDKVEWTKEPPFTLEFYYKEQAQRIRDSYDYVILFYSGGHDSTNILETFYYNNIKIDKIVIVGAIKQDSHSGVDENHNGELYHNCFPYLKELGLESITQLCDYTDYFDKPENFSIYQYGSDWVDTTGAWFSPHHWFWIDIKKYVIPHNVTGRVAMIFGKDKPNITTINDKPGFQFKDIAITSYGGLNKSDGVDIINFYWDPNNTTILVKQLHTMLSRYHKVQGVYLPKNGETADSIVYNLKMPIKFKSPKSGSYILSLRDTYLKHKSMNSELMKFYAMGIHKIKSNLNPSKLKPIKSKFYPII